MVVREDTACGATNSDTAVKGGTELLRRAEWWCAKTPPVAQQIAAPRNTGKRHAV